METSKNQNGNNRTLRSLSEYNAEHKDWSSYVD